MNIWLPIIINSILGLILMAGIFTEKKNGLLAIVKLFLVGGAAVGCYFLNPIVVNELVKLDFIAKLLADLGESFIPVLITLSLAILVLVSYLLISILIAVIRKTIGKEKALLVNQAKVKRARGIDKKTDRALRKEERRLIKSQRQLKQIGKTKQAIGIFFGFLITCIILFTIMFPVKYIIANIAESNAKASAGFEYTPVGQLDKITDIYDILGEDQLIRIIKLGE